MRLKVAKLDSADQQWKFATAENKRKDVWVFLGFSSGESPRWRFTAFAIVTRWYPLDTIKPNLAVKVNGASLGIKQFIRQNAAQSVCDQINARTNN